MSSTGRRNVVKLSPSERETLKRIFNDSLKELVEDESEMSDLLKFTVAMIQNGKNVAEMVQELDDIYGGEYAESIGNLLTDYFEANKPGTDENHPQHVEEETRGSPRVLPIKVRNDRVKQQNRCMLWICLMMGGRFLFA